MRKIVCWTEECRCSFVHSVSAGLCVCDGVTPTRNCIHCTFRVHAYHYSFKRFRFLLVFVCCCCRLGRCRFIVFIFRRCSHSTFVSYCHRKCSLFGSLTHACSWSLKMCFGFGSFCFHSMLLLLITRNQKQRRRKYVYFHFRSNNSNALFSLLSVTLQCTQRASGITERERKKIKKHLMALAIFVFFFIPFLPAIHTVESGKQNVCVYGGRVGTSAIQLCHNLLAINFYMNARCDQLINSVKPKLRGIPNDGPYPPDAASPWTRFSAFEWKGGSSASQWQTHRQKSFSNRRHQANARF